MRTQGQVLWPAISLASSTQAHVVAVLYAIQQELVYDAHAIARNQAELTDMDSHWHSWFDDQALESLRISCEELSASPTEVNAGILDHLDVDQKHADGIASPIAKLADEANKLWMKPFLSERI